jgi:hypothetical protein
MGILTPCFIGRLYGTSAKFIDLSGGVGCAVQQNLVGSGGTTYGTSPGDAVENGARLIVSKPSSRSQSTNLASCVAMTTLPSKLFLHDGRRMSGYLGA